MEEKGENKIGRGMVIGWVLDTVEPGARSQE